MECYKEFKSARIKDAKLLSVVETKYVAELTIVDKHEESEWHREILGTFNTLDEAKENANLYETSPHTYISNIEYFKVEIKEINALQMCATLIVAS